MKPLMEGRDVNRLNKALSDESSVERERQAHEQSIRDAMAGEGVFAADPLAPWEAFVKWMNEMYPKGSPDIAKVLESACRRFVNSPQYRDDPRYVRLWVRYADLREDMLDIFAYMRTKHIGEHCALFYEAWATTLERSRQYEEADKAYVTGVQKDAQPIERLKQRQSAFLARMGARVRRDEARARAKAKKKASVSDENNPSGRKERVRPALGTLNRAQASRSTRPMASVERRRRPPAASQTVAPPSHSPAHQDEASSTPGRLNGTNQQFEIYVDPIHGSPAEKLSNELKTDDFPFASIAKHTDVHKEDSALPTKWAGVVMTHNQTLAETMQRTTTPVAAPFEVYRDAFVENNEDDGRATRPGPSQAGTSNASFGAYRDSKSQPSSLPATRNDSANVVQGESAFSTKARDFVDENAPANSPREEIFEQPKEQRPQSPKPARKTSEASGAVSPTINTKIAMKNVEDMFNSPLPMEDLKLSNSRITSVLQPNIEQFEIFQDADSSTNLSRGHSKPPLPNTANGRSGGQLSTPGFEIFDANGTAVAMSDESFSAPSALKVKRGAIPIEAPFSIYRDSDVDSQTDKENSGIPRSLPSKSSQRRLEENRVLEPIPALEGRSPALSAIAFPNALGPSCQKSTQHATPPTASTEPAAGEAQAVEMATPEQIASSGDIQLLDHLGEWCAFEPNYFILEIACPEVRVGRTLSLHVARDDLRNFSIEALAGTGFRGKSQVFVAEVLGPAKDLYSSSQGSCDDEAPVAIKVQESNIWEFYIYKTLHSRLTRPISCIPKALAMFDGDSRSCMLLDSVSEASLSDVIRMVPNGYLSESVALFFTVMILHAVEAVHECGIIHTDVTLENVLLRNEGQPIISQMYKSDGQGGWNGVGIFLIDYNTSVDTRHSSIQANSPTKIAAQNARCGRDHVMAAYRKPNAALWSFDADCYAVSMCSSQMLSLEGRDVSRTPRPLRYKSAWSSFFHAMSSLTHLSPASETTAVMKRHRLEMEHLLACDQSLKGSLTRVLMHVADARYAADMTQV